MTMMNEPIGRYDWILCLSGQRGPSRPLLAKVYLQGGSIGLVTLHGVTETRLKRTAIHEVAGTHGPGEHHSVLLCWMEY